MIIYHRLDRLNFLDDRGNNSRYLKKLVLLNEKGADHLESAPPSIFKLDFLGDRGFHLGPTTNGFTNDR
jgi:hypothetical protein